MAETNTSSKLEKVLKSGHQAVTSECGPPRSSDASHVIEKGHLIKDHVDAYDDRRYGIHHAANQRQVERFGEAEKYTWSEDKARQYASPERAGFGAFIKSKGFQLK